MGVRSRCLAALLALLAAAGASRAEDPPPPAPEPRAPRQTAYDAIEQYKALQAAYEAERWKEVLDRVAACFETSLGLTARRWTVAMAATAAHRLEMWETCVQYCRAYAGFTASEWSPADDNGWSRSLGLTESDALLRLDRPREAETRLDEAAARFPDLREDEHWRVQRLAARPGDGVVFDLGSVAPSEARAIEEGRRRLERAIAPAIDHLKRRLGRSELRVPPLRFLVSDTEALLSAIVVSRGTGGIGIIRVRVEVLLQPTMADESCLAHEIAHLLHQDGRGASRPPIWLREGLAHWLEAADESYLHELVVAHAHMQANEGGPSVSMLLGDQAAVDSAEEGSQRACGAVIFFQLERMLGRAGMQRLVGRLLEESDYATVLREETGLPMLGLLQKVRSGYLQWAEATFAGLVEILAASMSVAAGDRKEALEKIEAFLAGAAAGAMRQLAELLRLEILVEREDWPAAVRALEPVRALRRERPLAGSVALGVHLELKVLAATGDFEGAANLARAARRSLWVDDPEERAEVEKVLAEAEKHLPVSPAPK